MTPDILFAVVGTSMLAAIAAAWGASTWLSAHAAGVRRLHPSAPGPMAVPMPLDTAAVTLDPLLSRLSKVLPRKSAAQLSRLQLRLTRAGLRQPHAAVSYDLAVLLCTAGFAAVALYTGGLAHWRYALVAAGAGYLAPGLWLARRTATRQKAIRNGLPDLLDLMTLCVEAGTGLDQAIAKATEELQLAHPALADEMQLMTTEIRAGRPRLEAFENFALRTNVEEVRTLVGMLSQTDRFGTSIGQALRTHAETTRTIRRQRAQERAAKVNVKLVFPLALCLFPALYVVVFGSVAVKIFRVFVQPGE